MDKNTFDQLYRPRLERESLMEMEEQMKADLLAGMDVLEMDRKYNYEQMLKK